MRAGVPFRAGTLRRAPAPGDWVLLALLLGAVLVLARRDGGMPADARLRVSAAGARDRTFDPGRDTTVVAEGPLGVTVVRIAGRQAWIVSSPCRNQLCVRMGRLRTPGHTLVCLPNRVMVRFTGRRDDDVDAVTR